MAGMGWHAGQTATAWATVDGGAEWFPQNASDSQTGAGSAAVSCMSAKSCIFIGGSTIWATADGGGMPPTTTLLAPLPAYPVFGQVIFLVAGVTGSYGRPTGTVAFSYEVNGVVYPIPSPCNDTPLQSGSSTDQGIAVCAIYFTGSGGGQIPLTAAYSGDAQEGSSAGESSIGLHEPGYRMVAGDGGIFDYGTAFHGSLAGVRLTYPINDCASDFETTGYWMVSAGGTVHPFDAPHIGDVVNVPVGYDPIVAVAGTLDGGGYWLIGRLGDVYAFGDASNYGSTAHFQANVVAIVPTPDDGGYWVAFSDGYVAAKGDATNYGNLLALNVHVKNIVGMASTPFGNGYWLVGSDGGIFTFGGAKYLGSMGGQHLNKPVVGMTNDPATGGYWLVASDGGIFAFDARFLGSAGSLRLNSPILSMSVG